MVAAVTIQAPAVDDDIGRTLEQGIRRLGFEVAAPARSSMLLHLELLARWNRTYNLTAVDDPRRGVALHVLDSLSIAPHLAGPRILDIGTGAGFPGLPLALARPEFEFVLLDGRGKKTRFVQHVLRAAAVGNVRVVQQRLEHHVDQSGFDTLVARAFSSLASLYRASRHLLAADGRILAMKGELPGEELRELAATGARGDVVPLDVPFLDAARHLVIIQPGMDAVRSSVSPNRNPS